MSILSGNFATNGHAANSSAIATLHKLPPQNLEAEKGVLGVAMLDRSTMEEIARRLRAEDFYRDAHQLIYRAILHLWSQGEPTDAMALAEELIRRGEFERVGGDDMLGELAVAAAVSCDAAYYADVVRQKAMARDLASGANLILDDVYSGNFTADELVNNAQARVMAVTEGRGVQRLSTLEESLDEAIELIRRRQGGMVTGLGSGYADIDALTCGFQPGSVIILAARPAMGKSALAANIAEYIAVGLARPVLFVSLEMTKAQLIQRMLVGRSGIQANRLAIGLPRLNRDEWDRLIAAKDELSTPLLTIDETPALGAIEIMATARSLHRKQPLGLIVVDYIQLVNAEDEGRSRQEQVAKISARLKALARELDVPVLALSQLNRLVEQREDRRPRMSDLRESGAIEQDAEIVMLVHRPEYYDPNDKPGVAEVIVAKNRHGAIGTVELTFRKDLVRFENCSQAEEPIDVEDF